MVTNISSGSNPDLRALFDSYIELYASRNEQLINLLSDDFSGFTVGGSTLVTERNEWIRILLKDFAEVPERIGIEIYDFSMQPLSDQIVLVSAFFTIQLPTKDDLLSHEVVRQVLTFRREGEAWKVVHASQSIPSHMAREGEAFPLSNLQARNQILEALVAERTRELNDREAFYRLLTEDTMDVIWRADKNLYITYISPSDERLRGFKAGEVVGKHVFELFNEEGVAIVTEALRQRLESERAGKPLGFVNFEAPHRCKDGSVIWGEVFSKAVRDPDGVIIGYHGITRENTKRKEMEKHVQRMAFYDALTNLPNRRLFVDRLEQALFASKRSGRYGALMFVDLDNFKPLNDQYGHYAGDLLLVEAAGRLKSSVREMDSVARFGGDEFVVLLSELTNDLGTSTEIAGTIAEKIRVRLSDCYSLNIAEAEAEEQMLGYRCSASIGVFVFLDHEVSLEDILKYADKAMYQAKEAGRNRVFFYSK